MGFCSYQVYYCIQTRSHALWGQQGALLNMLVEALKMVSIARCDKETKETDEFAICGMVFVWSEWAGGMQNR